MATPFNRDRFWWCTEFTGSQTVSDQISDKSKLVIRLSQSPLLLISGSGSLAQLSRSLLPQKTYIFILIKIIVQFFECQIPERVLVTGDVSTCKRFSKVSHRCEAKMCGLSLLAIFTFWVLTLWHITIVLYSTHQRLWQQNLSPSLMGSKQARLNATKSVLVYVITRLKQSLNTISRPILAKTKRRKNFKFVTKTLDWLLWKNANSANFLNRWFLKTRKASVQSKTAPNTFSRPILSKSQKGKKFQFLTKRPLKKCKFCDLLKSMFL